jgi:hypothetical protein
MTPIELESLAASIEERFREVEGWTFTFEYPSLFKFGKGDISIFCTPDYDGAENVICLEVQDEEGQQIRAADLPYRSPLTAEEFMIVMRPQLTEFSVAAQ